MPSELPHSLLATAFRLNPLLTNCSNNFIEIELYSNPGKMMPIVHINQAEIDFYLSQCIYSYFFALEEIKCIQQWKNKTTPISVQTSMCSKSLSNLSKTQTNWWRLKNSLCAHWSSFKADCNSQINKGSSILWSVSEYLFKTMFQIPESFLYCFHLQLRLKTPNMISWIMYIIWLVLT